MQVCLALKAISYVVLSICEYLTFLSESGQFSGLVSPGPRKCSHIALLVVPAVTPAGTAPLT
jgi:hypothetical protein